LKKLRYAPRADTDLEEIYAWHWRTNPDAADRILEGIIDAVEQLKHFPESGRIGRAPGTRELVVTTSGYVAAYRVRGDVVEIARVMHGRERWPKTI